MPNPAWLDTNAYPFASASMQLNAGKLHYVDQGQGAPVVMVHGTPTWSFLYRHLISDLARDHRCIAPDNLGFGLSEHPAGWSYRLADHARNLEELITRLELPPFTLVVHDLGGPIGLAYAIAHPERVRALVIFNTTLWPLAEDRTARLAGRLFGGPIGRWLYLRHGFSPRVIMPAAYGDRTKLTPAIHRQYLAPLDTPEARYSTWMLAREVLDATPWFQSLWQRRTQIANIPALLVWGMRDPAFSPRFLARLQTVFQQAQTVTLPHVGHFVPDEAGAAVVGHVRAFLS